jgi:3-phenylpropionate/trans-cinnamate dioxygenase ferredoxin subunit
MYNYKEIDPSECEFIDVAGVKELVEGDRLFISIDELQIVLFNLGGEIYAIGDICSHDDGPLGDGDQENYEIICPRHGARFDIRTGKALSIPAVVDIPAYPIRVVADRIEVGLPV